MTRKGLWWGDSDAAGVLQAWHASLRDDAAACAALRRVGVAEDALTVPAYARLVRDLRKSGYEVGTWRVGMMAAEAVAVAEVGRDDPDADAAKGSLDAVAGHFVKSWIEAKISGQRLRILAGTETPDLFSLLLRSAIGRMRDAGVPLPVVAVAEVARRHHRPDDRVRMRRALLFSAALEGLFEEKEPA